MSKVRHWRTAKLNDELLDVQPKICIERARLVTQAYQQTEGEPIILRRAKAIKKILSEMSIFIQRDQLIVGTQASELRAAPLFPETEALYLKSEIDLFEKREQDRLIVTPEVRKELLEEILPYWMDKNTKTLALNAMPDDLREIATLEEQIFSVDIHMSGSIGHVIVDYDKVLKYGFDGLKKLISNKMESMDRSDPENVYKYNFYRAELIICDAMIHFAHRYAKLAEEMATQEADERVKGELLQISEICSRVPEYPAGNFREAIQSFWFTHLMLYIEQNGLAVSVGRFDQFMYPYYKKSIDEGQITKQEAQELIECLWIKFTEIMRAYDFECAKYYAGFSISENLVLGGVDEDGKDAVNELSYMCLDAEDHTKLPQPNLSVRVDKNTPHDFLYRAAEVVSTGRSKPEFFNDTVGIASLMKTNVPLEDARDFSISGCVEPVPPHCNGMTNAAMSNVAKALELALNDGKCRLTGKQIGPKTGNPREFKSIDDVMEAFHKQVSSYVDKMASALNIIERIHADYYPLPYFSLVLDDCLERAVDVTAGGARYNFTGPQAVGFADATNAIAALKKMVFDEKKLTMDQMMTLLETNFEGQEVIRQMLINKVPKWGNDDDYVDEIGCEVAKIYCTEVSKHRNTRGGVFRPGIYSVSANVPLGHQVAALPNGKRDREALADGIGPQHGTDQFGPTAITCSCAKLDHEMITNGTILNQKLTPKLLESAEGKEALVNLITTYFQMGGWHIQFNVVEAETLKKAQEEPDNYKGLIIRVAGYSAFFVELDKGVQDDIISRTEQEMF